MHRSMIRTMAFASSLIACIPTPVDTGLSGDAAGGDDAPAADASTGAGASASDGGSSGESGDGASADESGGGVPGDGLPCDVDAFLATHCRSCHAGAPAISPTFLLSRDDLLADSISRPGTSVGVVAIDRLGAAELRMPPPPIDPIAPAESDVFTAWVADGMPAGDCMPEPPGPDPFDVEPTCTSDVWWTEGLFEGDDHMNPGHTCIACHVDPESFGYVPEEENEAPDFLVAGTIYPTAHEPDDCFGNAGAAASDVRIEITAQGGPTVVLTPNEAGNFFVDTEGEKGPAAPAGFGPPYLVKVIAGGQERAMAEPAPHGDCNLCHTQNGAEDALGRIIPPW